MYDPSKPDLIIHPKFYKSALKYNLNVYFNVGTIDDLTVNCEIKPILVTDKSSCLLRNTLLKPVFNYQMTTCGNYVSVKPENTSFYFERQIPIYRIEENGPRYVIWPKDEYLTICGTIVTRINDDELYHACETAKTWSFSINTTKTIIVFDLDDTLINYSSGKPFKYSHTLLKYARTVYDLVVLYSHGSSLHVDEHVQLFTGENGIKFDLVLSNNSNDKRSVKNLLSLYNYFPNMRFKNPTLVDDSLYNWSPEYEKFIVPSIKVTLKHALRYIECA